MRRSGLAFGVDRTDSESLVEAVQLDGQPGARPGDSGGPLHSDLGANVIAKRTMPWVAGSRVGFQDIPTANADFGGILNGFFHFPPLNSLSEELLKAEGKGVIGTFSPTGLSVNDAAHLFHKALLRSCPDGTRGSVTPSSTWAGS